MQPAAVADVQKQLFFYRLSMAPICVKVAITSLIIHKDNNASGGDSIDFDSMDVDFQTELVDFVDVMYRLFPDEMLITT
jgi:hypothetical protein